MPTSAAFCTAVCSAVIDGMSSKVAERIVMAGSAIGMFCTSHGSAMGMAYEYPNCL